MQRTWIYVDGFNLYYNSLKHTQYRWLDLKKLCEEMLASFNNVERIKYFTARVVDKFNTGCARDQQAYLDALGTLPEVEIIYGNFLSHNVLMPLATPPAKGNKFAEVIRTDEKGSDVNLASHLLNDAWKNEFDVAVVISNDSDLATPINMVLKDHKKKVGIMHPTPYLAHSLVQTSPSFRKKITPAHLKPSLFPQTIDATPPIVMPTGWDVEDSYKLQRRKERTKNNKAN
jgi:hypothetical protein